MARPNQEAIDTFIGITGASEAIAVQKLEEHGGDLNAAVNSHFSEGDRSGDRNVVHETSVATQQDDLMDIDDPIEIPTRRNHLSPLLEASMATPFSPLDPHFRRSVFNGGSLFTDGAPIVSQPREVREIPIEVKDSGHEPSRSGHAPIIEDVTKTGQEQGPGIHGTVIIADEDGDNISDGPIVGAAQSDQPGTSVPADSSHEARFRPSVPVFDDFPEYSNNDIEEEMIRAAIEASKQEAQQSGDPGPQQSRSHLEDAELAHAVSLSLKTAEQAKALHDQKGKVGSSEAESSEPSEVELQKIVASNGRLGTGSSSAQDEGPNAEEQPLVRHRSRCASSSSLESAKEFGVDDVSPPSSPVRNEIGSHLEHNGSAFPSDEWGGISSEEHDEAVMLEAAMFGGLPEGTGYRFPYAPHQFMQQGDPYPHRVPRPPSPSLQAERFIREQQDDEYLASLAADREKEVKAKEEAEARHLQEEAAREAALEEERRKEEEAYRKLEEEKELERQLAAKEASLPLEPAADDKNAITLLVRMPDGTRRGRRFLKSNSLQSLFDFMDIGRVVKPGTYRLVRPYPRRAFTDGDSALTLNELGLTSKQEALFLELI